MGDVKLRSRDAECCDFVFIAATANAAIIQDVSLAMAKRRTVSRTGVWVTAILLASMTEIYGSGYIILIWLRRFDVKLEDAAVSRKNFHLFFHFLFSSHFLKIQFHLN